MRSWTTPEVRRLKEMAQQGVPYDEISILLNRSPAAIYHMAHRLGAARKMRGRIPHLTPEQVKKAAYYRSIGWTLSAIGALLGVSSKVVGRALRKGYKHHSSAPLSG